jgi:hypothetical protein
VNPRYSPESTLPEGAGFIIGPMIGAALWLILILAHLVR